MKPQASPFPSLTFLKTQGNKYAPRMGEALSVSLGVMYDQILDEVTRLLGQKKLIQVN